MHPMNPIASLYLLLQGPFKIFQNFMLDQIHERFYRVDNHTCPKFWTIPYHMGNLATNVFNFDKNRYRFPCKLANSFYAVKKLVVAALEQQKVYIYRDLRVLFCTQAGVPQTVLLIPFEYSQLNLVHMCYSVLLPCIPTSLFMGWF